jgi:LysR family transcriptional activator of nhaA
MRHPNYLHLLHFWAVVREGGVVRAAALLHVTPQTISGQIRLLERQLDGKLLQKQGRRVVPTEFGLTVFEYADEIFSLGQDLLRVLKGVTPRERRSVTVGVSDAVPNLVAWRVLAPLLDGESPLRVICHSGSLEALMGDLAAHRLDLVLSSSPPTTPGIRAFSHFLGECDVAFFATSALARRLRGPFPQLLHQAPFLMPTSRNPSRPILDGWFLQQGITPRIVGEFDDSAMVKTFGRGGSGVFAAPAAVTAEVTGRTGMRLLGRATELRARFYLISMERRIGHPAVSALTQRLRTDLFAPLPARRAARPARRPRS